MRKQNTLFTLATGGNASRDSVPNGGREIEELRFKLREFIHRGKALLNRGSNACLPP